MLYLDYIVGTIIVVLILSVLLWRSRNRCQSQAEVLATTILVTLLGTGLGVLAALNLNNRWSEEIERQALISILNDTWLTAHGAQIESIKDFKALEAGGDNVQDILRKFRRYRYSVPNLAKALQRAEDHPGLPKHVLYLTRHNTAMARLQFESSIFQPPKSVSPEIAKKFLFKYGVMLQHVTHMLAISILQASDEISGSEARICQSDLLERAKATLEISEFLPDWPCSEQYNEVLLPVFAKHRLGESFEQYFLRQKTSEESVNQ